MDWYEGEETPKDVSVEEVDAILAHYFDQMKVCEEQKKLYKFETDKLDKMETKLLAFLDASGRKDYKSPRGLVFKVDKFSVKIPKTIEDKKIFFKYLEDEGLFFDKVNIPSTSLNSLYSEEVELAKQEQRPVRNFPGIESPSHISYLSHRKAK